MRPPDPLRPADDEGVAVAGVAGPPAQALSLRRTRLVAVAVLFVVGACGKAGVTATAGDAPTGTIEDSRPLETSTTTATTEAATAPTTLPTTTTLPRIAATATPTAEPLARTSGCHSSYQGACLPADASDVDCAGGSGNGPEYSGSVRVVGPDVFDLDRDGDGFGCESS